MTYRAIRTLPLCAVFALGACNEPAPDASAALPQPSPQVATPAPQPAPAAVPALIPEAERGAAGANNLLLAFSRAIEMGRMDEAYALLGEAGRAKWTLAQFRDMFDGLGQITAGFTSGDIEGGAGSLSYESALTITASDADGRPVRIEGPVVLRRVNDVDGASPAQLRWHFSQVSLDHTH